MWICFLQIDPTVIAYIIMHSTKYAFNLFSVIAKCLNKWSVMLLPCQLTSSQKKLCYCVLKEGWFNPNTLNRCIRKVFDSDIGTILSMKYVSVSFKKVFLCISSKWETFQQWRICLFITFVLILCYISSNSQKSSDF